MRPSTQSKTPISFRLPRLLYSLLQSHAEQSGISIHACARDLVTAELQAEHKRELELRLNEISQEAVDLRHDLSTVIELILINIANIPEAQVKQFVRDKLRS